MADVAIVNSTVTSAPTDYTVPGTQELLVKAVRASIDGSGAGSAFLPALQLIDPAGHVMWTAVDTSTTIAAGASADVSWFPDVSRSGGGSGSSNPVQSCYVHGINAGPLSVASGITNTRVPWQHFQTNDSSIFGTGTTLTASPPYHNTAGDKFVYFNAPGAYMVAGSVTFEPGAFSQSMIVDNPGGQDLLDTFSVNPTASEEMFTNVAPGIVSTLYELWSFRMFYLQPPFTDGSTSLTVGQTSGVNKNLNTATMGIYYLGGNTGTLPTVY